MTIKEALQKTTSIQIPESPLPVEKTCAGEMEALVKPGAGIGKLDNSGGAGFRIAVASNAGDVFDKVAAKPPGEGPWAYFQMKEDGSGELVVSHANLLYAYTRRLIEDWISQPVATFEGGKYYSAAFKWHRPLYDYLLTQTWRTARLVNPEDHIRELARSGYTHVEVNGLAMPVPFERNISGEYYSQFYSYCFALDQYVYSELNKGIYPVEYLTANLNLLKRYSDLGRRYGLEPGLLCFEPRTVPEKLFDKYPTLRGARVDHPFRSRLPRYTLTIAHPLVQAHYREMMQKLLSEVPDLSYMSIWSNDSGAGFEYTSSLYVGRNGGPYLIREWRTHEQIAEVAGKNVVLYMKILKEAADEMNPNFRVALRLEPFKVEHDVIIDNLEDRLDIEVPSLLVRGYDLPYEHDKYPDISGVAGSVQHIKMVKQERDLIEERKKQGVASHLVYTHGNGYNFEPLVGLPFPWLLHQKLQAMLDRGVSYAANLGGFTPSSLAPYHINQEVFRGFMLDRSVNVDDVINQKAIQWVGEGSAAVLVETWQQVETAVRWLPPLPLYSHFGFVWLRIWVRPIIPDLHAIPEGERRYYEDYLVSSANNTNLVDLGRDVLFDLITQEYGAQFVKRVDENVLGRLSDAIEVAGGVAKDESLTKETRKVFADQRDRIYALRSWVKCLRSVAAWVAGVYGYLSSRSEEKKTDWNLYLQDMIDKDIENTHDLHRLWETSTTQFMVVSKSGETSFIYGENFGELLQKKIKLMETYRHVQPRIDSEIMWRT